MLERCNESYSWCGLLLLFLPELKTDVPKLDTINAGF
jgi:hypothetical protein